jgi:hypothetical protein
MRLSGGPEKLIRGADVDPVFISGHDDPMLQLFQSMRKPIVSSNKSAVLRLAFVKSPALAHEQKSAGARHRYP